MKTTFKNLLFIILSLPLIAFSATQNPFSFYDQNWYANYKLTVNNKIISVYEFIDVTNKRFYIEDICTNTLLLAGTLKEYATICNQSVIKLIDDKNHTLLVQTGELHPNIDFYVIKIQGFQFNLNGQMAKTEDFSLFSQ